jgi:hypothetical protein
MNYLTKLEILYNHANLLPSEIECTHKTELLDAREISRLANGNAFIGAERSNKRKITIKGNNKAPDIFSIPVNSELHVISGNRFYTSMDLLPEYVNKSSVVKIGNETSYRIELKMITKNFTSEYNELEDVAWWTWILEEI